jgi:predicted aminopeptidase
MSWAGIKGFQIVIGMPSNNFKSSNVRKMHQKDKQVAAMNENFKAKMSEQESRFDAEIQLIRHENKVREGAISQEQEQREHDLTEQIKV